MRYYYKAVYEKGGRRQKRRLVLPIRILSAPNGRYGQIYPHRRRRNRPPAAHRETLSLIAQAFLATQQLSNSGVEIIALER